MGKYTKDWKKLTPQRPKRPMGAFARFVSSFNVFADEKSKTLFRKAADAWNALSEMEKAFFTDHDELEAYKTKMDQYKAKMSAMKGPPSAYALYVRYYWRTNDLASNGDTDDFGKIQKRIANDWQKLDQAEKKVYKASANLLRSLFEREQEAVVENKRPFNLEWQDAGLKDLEEALFKKSGKQVKKEDKDKQQQGEQDKDKYEAKGQEEKKNDEEGMDLDSDDEDDEFDYSMEED